MRMPARQQQPAPLDEVSSLVGGRKIIVASNRGPVEFHRDAHGKLTTRRGSGGVVTALAALVANLPLTWIATAMSEADREAFPDHDPPALDVLVTLQDYPLYLAAARVRERLPHAILHQFIHIPWPAARYWQFLPERFLHEIFESLAANDVLGFQTEGDARNFLECARWFLPNCRMDLDDGRLICRRHRLLARVYPVTADGEEIRQSLNSAAGTNRAQELRPLLADDRQVIVRVDRLEPTKNIVRGFLAYERLLAQHPELASTVPFLAFLSPPRPAFPLYPRHQPPVRT